MKNRMVLAGNGLIVIALVLWSLAPVPHAFALERSTTAVMRLVDDSSYFLGEMNGMLFYEFQSQLWRTDGTPAGTILLTEADPLSPYSVPGPNPLTSTKHYPRGEKANGLFFFTANDDLWISNGTPAGTRMVKDIPRPENFSAVNHLVFFTVGEELWRSDGTPNGTFFLTTLPGSSLQSASVNGVLLFDKEGDIWKSDGTVGGTSVLVTGVGYVLFGENNEDRLFFHSAGDNHLWSTDGTTSGTFALTDFPAEFHSCINGKCFFSESASSGRTGIWITDGTPAGTLELADMTISTWGPKPVEVNGIVYLAFNEELWKTDGTPAGTLFITDNIPISQFASAYGQLFFISAGQLWRSDGIAAGTGMVMDFGEDQTLSKFILLNGKLYLKVEGPPCSGYQCSQDWRLYKTDGTQTGTQWIADFAQTLLNCPTPLCSYSSFVYENSIETDEKWFFEALDGTTYDPHLWAVTDVFFQDVLPDHWAFPWVERLAETGVTGGCSPDRYCPEDPVTRGQIAIFLEKGLHYPAAYTAPNVAPTFGDTVGHWAEDWIEALKNDGITSGCAIGLYCPENPVTRAQMAVFLLKAKYGPSYSPPAVGASTGFTDVPTTYWAAAWIKQLAAESITGGCGTGIYCPESPVTRAQMAVFLVKTFGLP